MFPPEGVVGAIEFLVLILARGYSAADPGLVGYNAGYCVLPAGLLTAIPGLAGAVKDFCIGSPGVFSC